MARPPRTTSTATKTITIRVTVDEHAAITRAAGDASVSDWIRSLAIDASDSDADAHAKATAVAAAGGDVFKAIFDSVVAAMPEEKRVAAAPKLHAFAKQLQGLMSNQQEYAKSLEETIRLQAAYIKTLESKR